MAIQMVRAKVNGVWHQLTYNEQNGRYEASITAPGATSYNLPNGYYNVEVEATNTAGTTATADATSLEGLRLVVKERVKPVITITSPSGGAYVTNNRQPVVFTVTDEAGGSGVDLSSVVVKLDGTAVPAASLTHVSITGGYSFTYTPDAALSDGSHTVAVDASDNDGNAAVQKSTTFTVDTVPPTLNITAPVDGLITNTAGVSVTGVTNDATSSPVTIRISLNGTDQGSITVAADGSFSKALTLTEGENTIVITATDTAGKVTSVERTATLDTSVPQITAAVITPNPVDAGATMVISVTIS